ncbi:MAG TPA: hypothetical protein VKI20_09365, partial [Acidimicrobiales bacterium]|nr:hypothetical protein [Acidimicrobiales bacterium]
MALAAVGVLTASASAVARAPAGAEQARTRVYWDQNEEVDLLLDANASYSGKQLVPPWDPNGQLCVFPDGSGRFTVAYNPTGVEQ